MVVSVGLWRELADVLARQKFRRYFALGQAAEFLEELSAAAIIQSEGPIARISPDPKDDYLLALARSSGADYLVSGDKPHLLGLELRDYPPVISPRTFADRL